MKVLEISMGNSFGGIEKLELEYIKYLNKDFKIDILTPNIEPFKDYIDYIKDNNSNLYNFNINRKGLINKIKYLIRLKKFLKKEKYDIVHINSSVFLFSFQVALISKKCHVKKVIAHTHSIPKLNIFKRIIKRLLNPIYIKKVDIFLSCSNNAINSLLSNKYKDRVLVVNNGIDIDKYKYDDKLRKELRKKYNLENKKVYGNIARFSIEKNHEYLIDLFKNISIKEDNAILLLIGSGPLESKIKDKVNKLNLNDKVLFLGFKEDANIYLNCMDTFILPSFNEGLGIVAIEAQTNGLNTFVSTNIPKEANISKLFNYFSLDEDIDKVSNRIIKSSSSDRKNAYKETIKSNYDIEKVITIIRKVYKK